MKYSCNFLGLQTDGYAHQMFSSAVYKLTDITLVSLQTVLTYKRTNRYVDPRKKQRRFYEYETTVMNLRYCGGGIKNCFRGSDK